MSVLEEFNGSISEYEYQKRQEQKRKRNAKIIKALEDIKAETEEQYKWLFNTKYTRYDVDIAFNSIFRIIDKAVKEIEHEV